MQTEAPSKLKVIVNYGGRELEFSANVHEQVIALRNRVMNKFDIHVDRDSLALFRLDNSMLDDQTPVGAYSLTDRETLVLRQRRTGGG